MRNAFVLVVLAAIALGAGLISPPDRAGAFFHLMRVYAVGGGAFGNPDIQWVELRMTDPGQTFVTGHNLCFFDAAGAPYARFTFSGGVVSGSDEASILAGSSEFDAAWAAGSPNFTFSAANTVALGGGATPEHPIASPAGKVAFGTDGALTPALMCQGSFSVIDSVAYGTGYTGGVDFGSPFGSDLPTAATSAIRLQGPICFPGSLDSPCPQARDNSIDYALVDVNTAANNPRNNSNQSGPLSQPDTDGDGVPDASDNCPAWPNPGQGLPAWPVPAGDADCDGWTGADEGIIGTDANRACDDGLGLPDWPPDFDDNKTVNIVDVFALKPVFNTTVPPTSARFDLAPDGDINIVDVFKIKPVFNQICVP